MKWSMRKKLILAALVLPVLAFSGFCLWFWIQIDEDHLAYVVVTNQSDATLSNLEVSFPVSTFSMASLAPGEEHRETIHIRDGLVGFAITFNESTHRFLRKGSLQTRSGDVLSVTILPNFSAHTSIKPNLFKRWLQGKRSSEGVLYPEPPR